jgi:hypothetical protein
MLTDKPSDSYCRERFAAIFMSRKCTGSLENCKHSFTLYTPNVTSALEESE